MSETTPNPAPAAPASNMPLTAPTKASAPAPAKTAPAAQNDPEKDRGADLARLADLQKEYVDLRDKVSKADTSRAVATDPKAEALARKGEVTREMDAIKRKHGLA